LGGKFYLKESQIGKGSTFVAEVRVTEVEGRTQYFENFTASTALDDHKVVENEFPLDGKRILLVEDAPDNQELISIYLKNAGAAVDIVSDGAAGIEMAMKGSYSAIVMDIHMPGMGGLEAVTEMRKNGLTLPVVALTAHAMKEERQRCFAAGFSDFLSKPTDPEALVHALSKAATSPSESEQVLVVEDDGDTRDLIQHILESAGITVGLSMSAEDALEYLDQHPLPKLILTDLTLPNMSGADLVQQINRREDRSRTKVIIVSGWDDLARRAEVLSADGFLRKPINVASILRTVQELH
jgi:CheY-like chemotaxis protein